MRCALAVALLVAACTESFEDRTNRRLDTSEPEIAALRAELAALRMQVGALPVTPDVKPIAERVAALEAAMAKLQPAKQLHLVETISGNDLGILIALPALAWNVAAGGDVDYSHNLALFFEAADCSGDAWTRSVYFPRTSLRIIGPRGRILKSSGGEASLPFKSVLAIDPNKGADCTPWPFQDPVLAVRVADSGADGHSYDPALLSVDLR